MRMPQHKLSDEYIQELFCTEGRCHLEVVDSELLGFYFDVLSSGRKSFRVRYRFEKKLRVVTLGCTTLMTADEARHQATYIILSAKSGTDPTKDEPQHQGPTLQDFFVEKYLPYVKSYKRSWDTDESMIRNHLVTNE